MFIKLLYYYLIMEFSIIIPACNEEKGIVKTLKAIKAQKVDKEVIVVCNGCTDKTELVSKKYASTISIKDRNVSLARNLGAKKAKGNILIFIDADIIIQKNCLNDIKKKLSKNYVFGSCNIKPNNNKILARLICSFRNSFAFIGWATGIIFFKREVFFRTRGFENVKTKEVNKLIKETKKLGRFGIANCYVINNMRRYEKFGYIRMILFWLMELLHRRSREYPIIR